MKFYDAYNTEYYTERKRQNKKDKMKYLNFQRTGSSPLELLGIEAMVKDTMLEILSSNISTHMGLTFPCML